MTWHQKYRIKAYVQSCMWIGPAMAAVAALLLRKCIFKIDIATHWAPMGFDESGARGLTGIIAGAMLTFVVFLLSMLLLAVQIASAQLTPRVIAGAFRDVVIRRCVSYFVFAFVFAASTQTHMGQQVPGISVLCTGLLCIGGLILVFYVVSHIGRSLRPVSVVSLAASRGIDIIESVYPHKLVGLVPGQEGRHSEFPTDKPIRTVEYADKPGVLLAFDPTGLARIAAAVDCLIQSIPAVGDFVSKGDALFRIYGNSDGITDRQLHQYVMMGAERTVEQDPGFIFRVIVDIAIRALSPAVNDPTTAVVAIDQIHRLLLKVGHRDLGDGKVHDAAGRLRLVFPTPNWEDLVSLGITEIRQYGATSIQVLRRLRAMLEQLIEALPAHRDGPLRTQLSLLDEAAHRGFPDEWDRNAAGVSDYQGMGGARAAARREVTNG